MSYLLFDTDRSLASIGGNKGAQEILGLPPLSITRGVQDFKNNLNKIFERRKVSVPHPLFPDDEEMASTEVRTTLSEAAEKLGLQGLILDTASQLGAQERRVILKEREESIGKELGTLDQRGWGLYGDIMMRLWENLTNVDLTVIVTAHEKETLVQDTTESYNVLLPEMKGSSAQDMRRHFDVILYNVVLQKDKDEEPQYVWQTAHTSLRRAKTRVDLPTPYMEQDYSKLLSLCIKGGKKHPMILVIGDSGTGKTSAIKTLSNHQ